ncbi:DUF4328 domain-containing protein [Streptomyces sp. NRRL F-2747]|uniref:DUF4328 domain-containing protein n=1 Tax=Streptomyces sp. NRRL F-2747 TaxID=1463843 RepID=UPI000A43F588|nr:DUF4328 domain-containing protein [Streptomyces sp. NRRL F-2747]
MSLNEPQGPPTPPPAQAPSPAPAPAEAPTAPQPAAEADALVATATAAPAPEHRPTPPQPYPAPAYPAQPHPGPQPYPAPPYAGQPYAGQPYAGQPYPAQPYAGQPYAGQPRTGHPAGPYPGMPYAAPWPPADVLRSPRGLAVAVTALLGVAAAVNLFSAAISGYVFSLMKRLTADPAGVGDDALDRSDTLTAIAGSLQFLILLATAVVFIIWFHRVRVNGEIMRPDAFSQTRGWAIGGWFIPLGNLFLPYRTAKEIWTASTQFAPDGSFREVSATPVNAWWAVWVLSALSDRVFSTVYRRAQTPEALRDASAMGMVTDLLTVAAAVLAIVFVRKLTAMQTTKAEQGPYAAV